MTPARIADLHDQAQQDEWGSVATIVCDSLRCERVELAEDARLVAGKWRCASCASEMIADEAEAQL